VGVGWVWCFVLFFFRLGAFFFFFFFGARTSRIFFALEAKT